MPKILLMARATFRRRIFSSSFLLLTLGMPAIMIVAAAVPILQARRPETLRLGWVDLSHKLAPVNAVEVDGKTLTLETFDDPTTARQAVESGKAGRVPPVAGQLSAGQRRPVFRARVPIRCGG